MRAKDLESGESYSRRTRRGPIEVTVLSADPDEWGLGKVRVRVEEGISHGREVTVLCRDILAPWGIPHRVASQKESKRLVVVSSHWPPQVGDQVRVRGRGQLEWVVAGTEGDDYVLETEVFTRRQECREPLERLDPVTRTRETEAREEAEALIDEVLAPEKFIRVEAEHETPRAPIEPSGDSALARIIDSLTFSPRCLEQYRRLFAPRLQGAPLSDRLREELLRDGDLVRRPPGAPGGKEEYLRIRVRRRFDVILRSSPSSGSGILVESLANKRPVDRSRQPRGRRAA